MAAMVFSLVRGGGFLEAFWFDAEGRFDLVLREPLRPGAVNFASDTDSGREFTLDRDFDL